MAGQSGSHSLSLEDLLGVDPWKSLEEHLDTISQKIDDSLNDSYKLREKFRQELLDENPEIETKICKPSKSALDNAIKLLQNGTVAASDGTISSVSLVSGSKIQIGVVIVSNTGEMVDLVTKVFEKDLVNASSSARQYFSNLRKAHKISNLLARALMLFGERDLLLNHPSDWRMMHGELIPHELRTGAGNPGKNLQPTFNLINEYIDKEKFIAVSEATDDIDILNAAEILDHCEYIVIRSMEDSLNTFLYGDQETGQAAANFSTVHRNLFRDFITSNGRRVSVVLVKAGPKPFLIECHSDHVEEAVSLFIVDSLWTKGLPVDGSAFTLRGFPFHIDLADQVAGTLFKGSEFRDLVEARVFNISLESGTFDIDPRRTRS